MRWLLIVFTGLALMLSACGKIGSGEKIAVVNWEKVLQEHPQGEYGLPAGAAPGREL